MSSLKKKLKGSGKPKKKVIRQSSRVKKSKEDEPIVKIEPEEAFINIQPSEEACIKIEQQEARRKIEQQEACEKIESQKACVEIESQEACIKIKREEALMMHVKTEAHYIDQPVKIHSDALLEVWYKADSHAEGPESYTNLHYISPIPFESVDNFAMFNLYEEILKHLITERLNQRNFAEVNYRISPGLKGLWIKANGSNQKLPTILKDITSFLTMYWSLLTKDLFELAKKEILRVYRGTIMDPEKLVEDVRRSLTILHYRSMPEMYAALSNIEFHQFQDFVKHFTDHMYVQCYVQGNMERADVIEVALECIKMLNCRPLLPNTMPHHSMNKIPRGLHCCRVRSFDSQNLQSFVTNYYQFEDPSFKLVSMIDYLSMIMAHFLPRDNECDLLRGNFGMFGYAITGIVLEDDTVEDVDCRIEDLRSFFNRAFKNMTKSNLLRIKTKLITVKREEVEAMNREDNEQANWNEIMTGKNGFNREVRELEMINKMSLEELRMWMMRFTMGEYDCRLRKLSSQIVGYDDPMDDSDDAMHLRDNGNGKPVEYPLKYLTHLSKATKKTTRSTRDYYITDIDAFRRTLNILPWQNSSL